MKADGMAVEKIVKYTGLTAQEIETLLSLDMDKKEYETLLSKKKLEFIQQVMSETSLDTLCSWQDMYEEARYVASLDSEEHELKEFNAQYEESILHGFGRKKIEKQ